jgi:hypothetical protein
MASRRVTSKKSSHVPSVWQTVEEWVGIVLASLVMIVAAPMFVHAFIGDTAQAQSSAEALELSRLATQLTGLTAKVEALDAEITALKERPTAYSQDGSPASVGSLPISPDR